jgi:uncharacterized repeat protein (TIGR03803 family)
MPNPGQYFTLIPNSSLRKATSLLTLVGVLIMLATQSAAQTYSVLHAFNNQGDGAQPSAGVTLDRAGNLYGTTSGWPNNTSTVFELSRAGSGWTVHVLHTFGSGLDGALPWAGVVFGPDGTLYGTTVLGGQFGNGTVYDLRPPATVCETVECPWIETILYNFTGANDGSGPQYGNLTFDSAGNIYGTTVAGGAHDNGVVFKLSRSDGAWTESVLYSFSGRPDGAHPASGVTFDSAGNLYGTTQQGGTENYGTIYQLTPSGSGWTETVLFSFNDSGSGETPVAGVVLDQSGNLYGTARTGGGTLGTVYQLQPSNGNWLFNLLYSFSVPGDPQDTPTLDRSGNLFGTAGGNPPYFAGSVFKLTPGSSGWTYTDVYDFVDDFNSDGYSPSGSVVLDQSGNLYGTTFYGGHYPEGCGLGCGVVWEITP